MHKGAWFLVCSGALVNERTVVVAAHCVTDLGKITIIKTTDLKVVLGKFYRDDDRDEKTVQNLQVRESPTWKPGLWLNQVQVWDSRDFVSPDTLTCQ
jgi:V8-like Glu-specific endopeptidase